MPALAALGLVVALAMPVRASSHDGTPRPLDRPVSPLALGRPLLEPGGVAPLFHRLAATDPFAADADTTEPPQSGVVEVPFPPTAPPTGPPADAASPQGFVLRRPSKIKGFDAPRWVMARSLLVPGWGQLHNGSWIKAIAIATGEGLLVARMVEDNRALEDINQDIQAARAAGDDVAEEAAVTQYNARLDQLVRRQWLFAALLTYSLLDAYIDAHFKNFEVEFEHDPALPGGTPPGGAPAGKGQGSRLAGATRVALRWSF